MWREGTGIPNFTGILWLTARLQVYQSCHLYWFKWVGTSKNYNAWKYNNKSIRYGNRKITNKTDIKKVTLQQREMRLSPVLDASLLKQEMGNVDEKK